MVRINKVTTKNGDDGKTSLFGKQRVSKASQQIEAIGSVDELQAQIGMILSLKEIKKIPGLGKTLKKIQNDLFDLGSELATDALSVSPCPISEIHICDLEITTKKFNSKLPALKSFVLPGGSILNSWIHIARASARKAERKVVRLSIKKKLNPLIIIYLNRLSDFLFVLARTALKQQKIREDLWAPSFKKS